MFAVKKDLVKTRIKRAILRWLVNDLVSKVLQASINFGGAYKAVVESFNCAPKDAADKIKVEMDEAWNRMLLLLNMEYANAVRRIRANVVWDDGELPRNVARCTALVSIRLDKINEAFPVEVASGLENAGSVGPVKTMREKPIVCESLAGRLIFVILLVVATSVCALTCERFCYE